jgi:hypothetical protein
MPMQCTRLPFIVGQVVLCNYLLVYSLPLGDLPPSLKASGTSDKIENKATCSALVYAEDPFSLPPFFTAISSGSITENVGRKKH